MSFVTQIEREDAEPQVQRVYDAGKKSFGTLFNNWKVMAHAPHVLRGYTQFVGAVLNPTELDQRTLELAIFKTSVVNQCRYCLTHHYHYAIKAEITEEELLATQDYLAYDGFSDRDKTAIAFAEEMARNPIQEPYSRVPQAITEATQHSLLAHFSEVEIVELTSAVTAFNFINRFNRFLAPEIDVEMPPDAIMALLV